MRFFYTFFFVLAVSFNAFSQMEDHWSGVCENVDFSYTYNASSNPLEYTVLVDITNMGTDTIPSYCDVFSTSTPGVTLSGSPSCYPTLIPNETKVIEFTVTYADASVNCFDLDFKIKGGVDETLYCLETIQLCQNTPLNIEEIDRSNMEFVSTYYDLLGRIERKPLKKGFYVERRTYTDGFESVEKVFVNP